MSKPKPLRRNVKPYKPYNQEEIRSLFLEISARRLMGNKQTDKAFEPVGRLIATIHALDGKLSQIRELADTRNDLV